MSQFALVRVYLHVFDLPALLHAVEFVYVMLMEPKLKAVNASKGAMLDRLQVTVELKIIPPFVHADMRVQVVAIS